MKILAPQVKKVLVISEKSPSADFIISQLKEKINKIPIKTIGIQQTKSFEERFFSRLSCSENGYTNFKSLRSTTDGIIYINAPRARELNLIICPNLYQTANVIWDTL